MKEKLIGIYNLKPDATEADIIAAATASMAIAGEAKGHHAREKAIRDKINESCGAMNREQAVVALQSQRHPLFRN